MKTGNFSIIYFLKQKYRNFSCEAEFHFLNCYICFLFSMECLKHGNVQSFRPSMHRIRVQNTVHNRHWIHKLIYKTRLLEPKIHLQFTAIAEVGAANVFFSDYLMAVVAFFSVSIGGLVVGAIWAVLTGIVTKYFFMY